MKRLTARPLSPRRSAERGFVLLLVFAMAAGIAITLYLEMPRVAFQHQRNKEAMLVDRGEQYKRALELYVKKYNRFPQTIDELEKPDNIRLLRRRYRDPMTGKDEWRLIHIDNSGQYIDSLVHKKETEKKERHLLEADVQGIGASATSNTEEQAGPTPFLQRTASDRIIPGPGGGAASAPPAQSPEMNPEQTSRSGPAPPEDPSDVTEMRRVGGEQREGATPFNPGGQTQPGSSPFLPVPQAAQPQQQAGGGMFGQTQVQPGQMAQGQGRMQPGQVQPGQVQPGQMMPGQMMPGQMMPGQMMPGQMQPGQGQQQGTGGGFGFGGGFGMGSGGAATGAPPQPVSQPAPGGMPNPMTPQTGRAGGLLGGGGPQPGNIQQGPSGAGPNAPPPAAANEALRMIQNQLTRPTAQTAGARQGGAGQQGQQQGTLAGGLAGVASTLDLEGIRVYNERTNYKEWEFLADLNKLRGGRAGGAGAGQPGQPGQPGQRAGQGGVQQGGQRGVQGAGQQGGQRGAQQGQPGTQGSSGFGGSGFGAGRAGQQPGGTGQGSGRQSPPPAGRTGGGFGAGGGSQAQPRR